MGYLINSGTGFLKDAVTTVSNVKSYLVNKTGYLVDAIRVGIGDFGQRVLDDGGTVEASAEAAASYREITKDIYDQASLVLFPSGYKDNLLYSHKPVDGSGDFTYTRGTDTTTRVGADGYIKKERANLLLQSNQFDTTWIVNTSVSEGEEGYDGTNDAWSLTRAAGGSLMARQENVTLSGVSTYSIYAKINTNNGIGLAFNGLSTAARFDLRDATKTQAVTETGIISSSQEYVGNGFYRLSITADVSGSTQLRIYLTTADATTSDGNGGTHIIQDAQVEQGLVPTSYIETTTAPVYEGLTDNLPRIDYTGGTPSILLEPSRTNVITHSEYIDEWNQLSDITTTPNDAISPEGIQNAYKVEKTSSGFGYFRDAGFASTGNNVFSIFAKKGNARYIFLASRFFNGFTDTYVWFDIENGTKGGRSGESFDYDIEDYGNGWYRCYLIHNVDASDLYGYCYVGLTNTDENITGESGLNGYFYGGQWEAGTYPTSYIPTYNASATRAADLANGAGDASTFNDSEGVLYTEMAALAEDSDSKRITISDGTLANRITISISSNTISGFINVNNVTEYTFFESGQDVLNPIKIAVKYKINDFALWINGTEYDVSSSGNTFSSGALSQLSFDNASGANNLYGNVKQVLYFPTALSDDDCEALTAL